jgi:hypothetical protein
MVGGATVEPYRFVNVTYRISCSLRNNPDFIWAFNSLSLSCTTTMGKFNEKLNNPSGF